MRICCMAQETQTGVLYQPRWEGKWEGGSKGRVCVYIYIYLAVYMADSCWSLTEYNKIQEKRKMNIQKNMNGY